MSESTCADVESSFVFKSISRNDYYEAKRNKDKIPP
jgi:hypothetical protein